jgi:hypothetical protein
MFERYGYYGSYRTTAITAADFHPIGELLRRQSKGIALLPGEKIRLQKYAEEQRKKNAQKKKVR